jgi:hypothetical protein
MVKFAFSSQTGGYLFRKRRGDLHKSLFDDRLPFRLTVQV